LLILQQIIDYRRSKMVQSRTMVIDHDMPFHPHSCALNAKAG
jgi:hypothetical protein